MIGRQICWCGEHPSVTVLTHFSERLSWSHSWQFLCILQPLWFKRRSRTIKEKAHILIVWTVFPVYIQHVPWREAWTIVNRAFLIICMPLYEIWHQNMKGGDCGDWFVPFLLPSDVDEEALSEREEAGRTDVAAVPLIMRKRRWGLASLKRTGLKCADILNPKYRRILTA